MKIAQRNLVSLCFDTYHLTEKQRKRFVRRRKHLNNKLAMLEALAQEAAERESTRVRPVPESKVATTPATVLAEIATRGRSGIDPQAISAEQYWPVQELLALGLIHYDSYGRLAASTEKGYYPTRANLGRAA